MERHGFIHTMTDTKILILFTMYHVKYPVTDEQIYALSFWDECLSYFDVKIAIPEMVGTGHLEVNEKKYTITEKGRNDCLLLKSGLAYPVGQRVLKAVSAFNEEERLRDILKTKMEICENNTFRVSMRLKGDSGEQIFAMEFLVDSEEEAEGLEVAMGKQGEIIHETIKSLLLEEF